jgi:hypothetical protein
MRRIADQNGLFVGKVGDSIAEHLIVHLDVGCFSWRGQLWLHKKLASHSQIAWIEGWNAFAQPITSSTDAG